MSRDYNLCDALALRLQTALPGETIQVVSDPRVQREELTGWVIRLTPAACVAIDATREADETERRVHVVVVGPCLASDTSKVREALALADSIKALWGRNGVLRRVAVAGHTFVPPTGQPGKGGVTQSPLYDTDALLKLGLFVAALQVPYRIEE